MRVAPNGLVYFNAIRVPGDPLDPVDLSRCEIEGRMRVHNYVAWLRARVPGCAACCLVKTAPHIGVRESRRIVGDRTLDYHEVYECFHFEDGIAGSSYHADIHPQTMGGDPFPLGFLPGGQYYTIPYPCLIPQGLENLLVAGRSISADRVAFSAMRVMPPVMSIGQAAGTAAAMALPDGDVRAINVQTLRQKLRDQGAVVD